MNQQSLLGGGLLILLGCFTNLPQASANEIIRHIADTDQLELPDYPPLRSFSEVSRRPLFSVDRKASPRATSIGGGNEQKLRDTWRLTGITLTPDRLIALFEERQGKQRLRLEQGMQLDHQWQLDEIRQDGVSLVSGNQQVWLQLHQPRQPVSTGATRNPAPENNNQSTDAQANKESPVQQAVRGRKAQTM